MTLHDVIQILDKKYSEYSIYGCFGCHYFKEGCTKGCVIENVLSYLREFDFQESEKTVNESDSIS